jgi:hypothetical protein
MLPAMLQRESLSSYHMADKLKLPKQGEGVYSFVNLLSHVHKILDYRGQDRTKEDVYSDVMTFLSMRMPHASLAFPCTDASAISRAPSPSLPRKIEKLKFDTAQSGDALVLSTQSSGLPAAPLRLYLSIRSTSKSMMSMSYIRMVGRPCECAIEVRYDVLAGLNWRQGVGVDAGSDE